MSNSIYNLLVNNCEEKINLERHVQTLCPSYLQFLQKNHFVVASIISNGEAKYYKDVSTCISLFDLFLALCGLSFRQLTHSFFNLIVIFRSSINYAYTFFCS